MRKTFFETIQHFDEFYDFVTFLQNKATCSGEHRLQFSTFKPVNLL